MEWVEGILLWLPITFRQVVFKTSNSFSQAFASLLKFYVLKESCLGVCFSFLTLKQFYFLLHVISPKDV